MNESFGSVTKNVSLTGAFISALFWAFIWILVIGLIAYVGHDLVLSKSSNKIYGSLIITGLLTLPILFFEVLAEARISKNTFKTHLSEKQFKAIRLLMLATLVIVFFLWGIAVYQFEQGQPTILSLIVLESGPISLDIDKVAYTTATFVFLSRFATWIPIRVSNTKHISQNPIGAEPPSYSGDLK